MPTRNWPSTPMLNSPPLKHTATASAEKISGVAIVQHVAEAVRVAERETQDRAVDRERALAVEHDDDGADEQRECTKRHDERERLTTPNRATPGARVGARQRPWRGRHQLASDPSSAAPSMPEPTSSGGASGANSPVIRPS